VGRRHPRAVLQVLHPEGHAGERAGIVAPRHGFVDGLRVRSGRVGVDVHEGVEVVVAGGDGVEALIEYLGRLEPARPDGFGDLNDRAHRRSQ